MTQMLSNFQIGLNFMSGMALFVGAFLIYNAFAMTVAERTREFGMLRTVGMSSAQITFQVLGEALILGIIGSGLGLGLGMLLARGLTQMMQVMLAQNLTGIVIPREVVITGTVVGVLVAVLAALIPALQAGKISPLEALLVRGRSQEGLLIRFGWIPGLVLLILSAVILVLNPFPYDVQFRMGSMVVFGLFLGATLLIPSSIRYWERSLRPFVSFLYRQSGRLGSGNVLRTKLRTTLTVAALMIGVSMIVIVWAITGSFKGDLDEWLTSYTGGDLYISSSVPMGGDVWKRLLAVEGVQAAAPVHFFNVKWFLPSGGEEEISFMALDPASYTQVTTFQFSQTEPDPQVSIQQLSEGDSVFISSVISEKYGLQPGDSLTIQTKTGPHVFNIAGVVVSYYNQGMVITGNWNDMTRYFRQKEANAFLIRVEPGTTPDQVGAVIDDLYGKRDRLVVESSQALLGRISLLMQQAFSLFDVLALIAILVGFLGIANTLTMNVIERTQEIGMLRAVGMTQPQTISMVLAEAGLIGLVGGFLGVILGAVLARIFMLAMTAMSGYRLVYSLPLERVVWAVAAALLVSQLAALFPALRAARTRILEAIHYE
jgi:putative ABC transport system permease protein